MEKWRQPDASSVKRDSEREQTIGGYGSRGLVLLLPMYMACVL